MAKLTSFIMRKRIFLAALLWLVWLAVATAWPASYWLTVESVRVADAVAGKPIPMLVDRTIHRPFEGVWTVYVREISNGTNYKACAASATSDYVEGVHLPRNLDLGWWTNGVCQTLPVGSYAIHTKWSIVHLGLLPDKHVEAVSNIFKITEAKL